MRAVVCGAGIAGLTVARELARGGWDVTLLESAPGPRDQGYLIDFFGPGLDAADAMGLRPRLEQLARPVSAVALVDDRGRTRRLRYDLVARDQGGPLLSLMRQDLELALRETVPPAVDVRWGAGLEGVEDGVDAVTAVLSDGSRVSADVLVGADGIHSTVRRLVFGPEEGFVRQLGFHTCAYVFDAPHLHGRLGDELVMTDSIDRVVGMYALRDGKVAMFGAHRVDDAALPPDPRAAVVAAYSGLGWLVPEALEHCRDASALYYDQVAQVEISPWSSGRVVLVGDACQAVSLLAGQGASLAVAAGRALAHELSSSASVADACRRYAEQWMPLSAAKQAAGRRSAASFLPRSRSALLLRRAGLGLVQVPVVGRLLTSRLVGERGAGPRV